MQIHGAIFDLDGTLADTLPLCFVSYREVFQKYTGIIYSDEQIADMFGPSDAGMFQRKIPDQWELALDDYLEIYARYHSRYGKKFDGIDRVLELLKRNKIPMAIVTGKGQTSAEISLNLFGIGEYFDILEAGKIDGAVKPEAIKRILGAWELPGESVFYVGDITYDIRSAHEAGVIALGAGWSNTMTEEELLVENPHVIFSSVVEFTQWLINDAGLRVER
jgi:pyrophosphatase PpaX